MSMDPQKRKRIVYPIAFAAGLAIAALLAYWSVVVQVPRDVPYVVTPDRVVDQMLALADAKAGEVIYDLGCGDGRIVIAAGKRFGMRGVGVEIDPELIAVCNENAREAGVEGQVRFVQGDLFAMDFHDADVVALYLREDLNVRLRPKLLAQLKPGSRVVSHRFGMGDWKPDREVMAVAGGNKLYLWVIPAKPASAPMKQ
jgi:SAM-dependent methyltransferase